MMEAARQLCILIHRTRDRLIHIFRDGSMRYWKLFRRNVGRAAYTCSRRWLCLFVSRSKNRLDYVWWISPRYIRSGISLAAGRTRKRNSFFRKVIPISHSVSIISVKSLKIPSHNISHVIFFISSIMKSNVLGINAAVYHRLYCWLIYLDTQRNWLDIFKSTNQLTFNSLSAELIWHNKIRNRVISSLILFFD